MITLKTALRANATSCIVFGLLFLISPNAVASFLAEQNPAPNLVLQLLGGILLFNGLHLVWASFRPNLNSWWVIYFSMGDFIWVLASIGLVITGLWITTTSGIVASALVALMVGVFGALQWVRRK